jgi:DNA-directed RNA polymerase specialized sigma24 family protein
MEDRLNMGKIFQTDFDALWKQYAHLIRSKARPQLLAGLLSEEDLHQDSWIVWEECRQRWDPERSAFATFFINQFENTLRNNWRNERRDHQNKNTTDEDFESFQDRKAFLAGSLGSQPPYDEHLPKPIFETDVAATLDMLRSMPIYQKPTYRAAINLMNEYLNEDGALCSHFSAQLAQKLQITPRRSRQIVDEIGNHLRRSCMHRDNQILARNTPEPISLSFRPLSEFILIDNPPQALVRAMAHMIHRYQRCLRPILIDQFGRVLEMDGAVTIEAAKSLNMVAAPFVIMPIPGATADADDPALLAMLRQLRAFHVACGRVSKFQKPASQKTIALMPTDHRSPTCQPISPP